MPLAGCLVYDIEVSTAAFGFGGGTFGGARLALTLAGALIKKINICLAAASLNKTLVLLLTRKLTVKKTVLMVGIRSIDAAMMHVVIIIGVGNTSENLPAFRSFGSLIGIAGIKRSLRAFVTVSDSLCRSVAGVKISRTTGQSKSLMPQTEEHEAAQDADERKEADAG
ncbi:MAG: hypothetical protein ACTFAL_10605 [Candidatus Electronema sp. V4]|uniref:hypothetical protein n=1 Tax=Candidatus Electronema sp. V4 TaxID=3454756 RepID=UPI0040558E4E